VAISCYNRLFKISLTKIILASLNLYSNNVLKKYCVTPAKEKPTFHDISVFVAIPHILEIFQQMERPRMPRCITSGNLPRISWKNEKVSEY
jgi:hypothetical protein